MKLDAASNASGASGAVISSVFLCGWSAAPSIASGFRTAESPPPGERTVGQLVAEAIRLYGRHFWRSLALGFGPALLSLLPPRVSYREWLAVMTVAGGLILSASYIGAVAIAADARLGRRAWL